MPFPKEHIYTIEDIYNLPEGQRAELIDGRFYNMAPPSPKHQAITGELFADIRNYVREKGGPCKIYISPFAVFLNKDDTNYVEPDITVICKPDKIDSRGCKGAPDWVVEVVSPGSRRMDYSIKLFKYRSAGVREYWIVDPDKNRIMVHNFEHEDINEYTFSDTVKTGIYEDLSIDFSKLEI